MPLLLNTVYSILIEQKKQQDKIFSPKTTTKRVRNLRIAQLSILLDIDRESIVEFEKHPDANESYTKKKESLKLFISQYCEPENQLGEFLFGESFKSDFDRDKSDILMLELFNFVNDEFKNLQPISHDELEESPEECTQFYLFEEFYVLCQFHKCVIEDKLDSKRKEVAKMAYKMSILFDSISEAETFLKTTSKTWQELETYSQLPRCKDYEVLHYDLESWKSLMNSQETDTFEIWKLFHLIPKIEKKLQKETGNPITKSVRDFKKSAFSCRAVLREKYKEFAKNPELAAIFNFYDVENEIFEKCLSLYRNNSLRKTTKTLVPQIIIDLKEIKESCAGYHFIPLPKEDYRGLILGYTAATSCQKIGGFAHGCVMDGMNRRDTCFYVLVKSEDKDAKFEYDKISWDKDFDFKFKIVGYCYVWLSDIDIGSRVVKNIIFDSFEISKLYYNFPLKEVLQEFSKQAFLANPNISRVTVGAHLTESNNLFELPISRPEDSFTGSRYYDSRTQREVAVEERMIENCTKIYEIVAQRYGARLHGFSCYEETVVFLENLKDFPDEELEKIQTLSSIDAIAFSYKRKLTAEAIPGQSPLKPLESPLKEKSIKSVIAP